MRFLALLMLFGLCIAAEPVTGDVVLDKARTVARDSALAMCQVAKAFIRGSAEQSRSPLAAKELAEEYSMLSSVIANCERIARDTNLKMKAGDWAGISANLAGRMEAIAEHKRDLK